MDENTTVSDSSESEAPTLKNSRAKTLHRRELMEAGFWASAGAVGLIVTGSGIRFVVGDSLEAPQGKWVEVGNIADLSAQQIHKINYTVRRKDAWRTVEQKGILYAYPETSTSYTVLDSTCTHLGCNVHWKEEEQHFRCPCHEAYFDKEGNVMSGPPPAPLARLETKIENDILYAKV